MCKSTTAYAELSILGTDLDVENISEELGLKINHVRKEKDYSAQPNNSVSVNPARFIGQYTIWNYKAEEKNTINIDERLDELISVFEGKEHKLKKIKDEYNCKIMVSVVIYIRQDYFPSLALSEKQIEFLSSIGASIDFDIYPPAL